MHVKTLEEYKSELESRPLSDEEWRAFFEQWVRELPEKRRRTREAIEGLRLIAQGRDPR